MGIDCCVGVDLVELIDKVKGRYLVLIIVRYHSIQYSKSLRMVAESSQFDGQDKS